MQAVSCGAEHTLAIVRGDVNNLFSWGLNKKCQCGHPASRRKLDLPSPVPSFQLKKVYTECELFCCNFLMQGFPQVLKIAAGLEHSLVITVASGAGESCIYAFGDNSFGQLGTEVKYCIVQVVACSHFFFCSLIFRRNALPSTCLTQTLLLSSSLLEEIFQHV
jgi:alpha-tubulin suppressor-like RCC1 family protein